MDKPIVINCTIAEGGEDSARAAIAKALEAYSKATENSFWRKVDYWWAWLIQQISDRKP